jgi:glycosyltransferase involved in cell wall biosynthesis
VTSGAGQAVKILSFGTYDVRTHPRCGVLIEGFRASGDEVVEVNVPLGIGTAGRVAMLRQPWRLPQLAVRLAWCWGLLAWRGRRAFRRHHPDLVLVGYLGHFDVQLARQLFRRTPIVLDHLLFAADTARDRGETGTWKGRLLDRLDRAALRAADLVLLDTDEHLDMVPADLVDRAVVVPVGAPQAWLAAGADRLDEAGHRGQPLRVAFFGLFTPLQGTPVIGAALGALARDHRVRATMVGSGQDLAETRRLARGNPYVEWRDWVPSVELPALVAGHDVCLGIFGTGPKARRVVPNKVYQGAAVGSALVTSDTPPQRAALDEAAAYVPAGDPLALADVLRELASDPVALAKLRAAALDRARERFTPRAVVAPLRERLVEVIAGRPPQ